MKTRSPGKCMIMDGELYETMCAHIEKLERLLSEAGIVIIPDGYISDGFGNIFPKYCERCGAENMIIRPGDCRCSRECDR